MILVGALFAESARLEAASVTAFRILRRELGHHRAPVPLLNAACRAAVDEIAHTRITAALARRYGARPLASRTVAAPATRTLEEIAVENAVEGCVRETYGVLVARWQVTHAADPLIRRAMAGIAEDETRHTELAWAVARWVEPRLSRAARSSVHDARAAALESLRAEVAGGTEAGDFAAGMPSAAVAQALVSGLAAQFGS